MSRAIVLPGEEREGPDLAHRITDVGREGFNELRGIRVFEFVCGFLLFSGFFIQTSFQPSAAIVALLVFISLGRKPKFDLGGYQLLLPLFAVAGFYLAVISYTATPTEYAADWKFRLVRMAVTLAALFIFASGRIHLKSTIYGFAAALMVNIPLFFAGLVPDTYGGYLTGWAVDKNYAGLVYCLIGLLMLAYAQRPWVRFIVFAAFAGALWLTGSRTSLAAYAAAIIWVVLASRIGIVGRWFLGIAIYFGVMITAEDYSQIGQFSDREGSDLLRARIDEASQLKVDDAGFFGMGLGEAVVPMEGRAWFFHNSYWTALVEGGWPWLAILLVVMLVVSLRPFSSVFSREQLIGQALGIAILICAWRLGEVFVTLPWMLALAYALRSWIDPIETDAMDGGRGSAFDSRTDRVIQGSERVDYSDE